MAEGSTRVQLADGRIVRIQTDNPQEAVKAARRIESQERVRATPAYQQQRQRIAARTPEGRRAASDRYFEANPNERFMRPVTDALETVNAPLDDFVSQITRNMGVADEIAGGTDFAAQGIENLFRRATGRPIETPAATAYQAAADLENEEGARIKRERPVLDALATGAGFAVTGRPTPAAVANPNVALRVAPALRTGAGLAAANAPLAVARQEGDLVERLPGAAVETAATMLFGAGGQKASNVLARGAPTPIAAEAAARRTMDAGERIARTVSLDGLRRAPMGVMRRATPWTAAALLTHWKAALAAAVAARGTGALMRNPNFARWLASAPRAGESVSGLRRHMSRLATMATRNPQAAAFYSDLQQSMDSDE